MNALRYFLRERKRTWAQLPERSYDLKGTPLVMRAMRAGEEAKVVTIFERAFEEERQSKEAATLSPGLIAYIGTKEARLNSYVVLVNDEIIGFGAIDMAGNDLRLERELVIKYIYIVPEHRGIALIIQKIAYLKEVARLFNCPVILWGFDAGKGIKAKVKLAQLMGFEKIHSTFLRSLPKGAPKGPPVPDTKRLSLATLRRYGGYYKGSRLSFAVFALMYPLIFRLNVRGGLRVLELAAPERDGGYLFAMVVTDHETSSHFCLVEACHNPSQEQMETLVRWAQGIHCTAILIDTGQTGPMDPQTAARLPDFGFEPNGSSHRLTL